MKKLLERPFLALLSCALIAGCGGGPRPSILPAANQTLPESPAGAFGADGFNSKGNKLISDQWNNRVIEVNSHHRIVWHFGDGSAVAGPHSVVGVNDAERYGNLTLIAGTGLPAGTIPACSSKPCQDNRVIVVDRSGKIVWQYGKTGVAGSGPNELNAPVSAIHLSNGDVMITDQGNQRVIEVTKSKKIVWQYGKTGKAGSGLDELRDPNSVEMLSNGNVLIADESNNRVLEVTKSKNLVWSYGSPKNAKLLNGVGFASRLKNGNTLITDSGHSRIVEVNASKHVVWSFLTNKQAGSIKQPEPSHAVRLANGNTLVSNQIDENVVVVDPSGKIVFEQGKVGLPGTKFDELNWPYDAKAIGDFTGLTPP